jgi:hypothetical protein
MIQNQRTTKCGPITSEMTWREILVEFRKIENDHDAYYSLADFEKFKICFALFAEDTERIISTFPPNLSKREFKERLYFERYGEHLPDDFFEKFPA